MATSNPGKGTEWGPWIRHDGKGCPVRPGTLVEVVCEDRFGFTMRQLSIVCGGSYSSWNWTHFPELKRILRYREQKPKSLPMQTARERSRDMPSHPRGVSVD
ncbi:hypothetical protein [Celeribacter sp.]|uniref:hypothetical protein n=1 Tax=Celeribacter sp. TaxID=1890673 RepID=UPI003A9150F8